MTAPEAMDPPCSRGSRVERNRNRDVLGKRPRLDTDRMADAETTEGDDANGCILAG